MRNFIGHHGPKALIAVLIALIALTLAPAALPMVVTQAALLGLLALAGGLSFALFGHTRALCERCIAALPLDAAKVAARYRLRFRIAHLAERKPIAFGYLALVAVASFVYPHPIGRFAAAAAQASLAYLLVVYATHQRLQPWCPGCENGGEESLAPVIPLPVSSRS
jgi:hypothetical protein